MNSQLDGKVFQNIAFTHNNRSVANKETSMTSSRLSVDGGSSYCKNIAGLSVFFSYVDCITLTFQEIRYVLYANEGDLL